MEDILSVYQRDYSTENPLVCMDETSKQLTKETRNSIPANSNHLDKVDFHYTPKHGSWLNMAGIEFSILGRECLDRRIEDKVMLQKEVAAWTNDRNSKKNKITWRFKNEEVRIKLKRLYPLLE